MFKSIDQPYLKEGIRHMQPFSKIKNLIAFSQQEGKAEKNKPHFRPMYRIKKFQHKCIQISFSTKSFGINVF